MSRLFSKNDVIIFAEDPGAADYISPLIKLLLKKIISQIEYM